jgi:hypothetical protein
MSEEIVADRSEAPHQGRRLSAFVPLAVVLTIGVFLAIGLTLNLRELPSPLIGKPVPEFSLPPVKGRTLGVYGVPETFVIDRQGRIAYKQIGPVTPEVLEKTILPLIRKLRQ